MNTIIHPNLFYHKWGFSPASTLQSPHSCVAQSFLTIRVTLLGRKLILEWVPFINHFSPSRELWEQQSMFTPQASRKEQMEIPSKTTLTWICLVQGGNIIHLMLLKRLSKMRVCLSLTEWLSDLVEISLNISRACRNKKECITTTALCNAASVHVMKHLHCMNPSDLKTFIDRWLYLCIIGDVISHAAPSWRGRNKRRCGTTLWPRVELQHQRWRHNARQLILPAPELSPAADPASFPLVNPTTPIGKSDNSHRSFAESNRASERLCRPQSSSLRRQQRSLLLSQLLRPCRCSARCPRPPQWRCSSSPRTLTTTRAPERWTWGWEVRTRKQPGGDDAALR